MKGCAGNVGKRVTRRLIVRSKAKDKDKKDEDKKGTGSANAAVEGEEFVFTTTFAGSTLALGTSTMTGQEVDVYDLGTSGHMSPNKH